MVDKLMLSLCFGEEVKVANHNIFNSMASRDHLKLSAFIKKVHENLRTNTDLLGFENAWKYHCSDGNNLKMYAAAMKELATNYWEKNNDKLDSKSKSRVKWTVNNCITYFYETIHNIRLKEKQIANKLGFSVDSNLIYTSQTKLQLLDVGSCYNPFRNCIQFEVIPIDIAPAIEDVYRCDFLSVSVGYKLNISLNEIIQLPRNYFDVIVFSLLLEYLPSPFQRKFSCEKAYDLLKPEGVLIIISPDSNHIGANAQLMKSWRFILAKIGYSRIKYEKLPHIHCMAFRKSYSQIIPKRWADLYQEEQVFNEMYIPQDLNIPTVLSESDTKINKNPDTMVALFKELPIFIQD